MYWLATFLPTEVFRWFKADFWAAVEADHWRPPPLWHVTIFIQEAQNASTLFHKAPDNEETYSLAYLCFMKSAPDNHYVWYCG